MALLLCCVGLYGLISYDVARRRGEIAVRMALGATWRHVAGPVLGEALWLALAGIAIGVPVILALSRLVRSQLYGVAPIDLRHLLMAGVVLLLIATVAAWIPARRATKIDPMEALRAE